jgi:hypothetical protein
MSKATGETEHLGHARRQHPRRLLG